jgi:hypothetical protein
MTVRDLRAGPPRRWSEQVSGICWLPRLIDKARAAQAGCLGDYLYGQSPMDHGLLRVLGLSHRGFAEIVASAPGDDAVVAAIAQRDPAAIERARAWSARLPIEHRLFFWFVDVDDGYRGSRWLHGPVTFLANRISRTAKRLWPWPRKR